MRDKLTNETMKTFENALKHLYNATENNPALHSIVRLHEEYAQERTKDCYPKEFVEWKDKNFRLAYGTYFDKKARSFNTLEELFIYWKEGKYKSTK